MNCKAGISLELDGIGLLLGHLGKFSPVDFTVSKGRPIRAKPSADFLPFFNTAVDGRNHKPRFDLCRATASSLLKTLEQQRFNVRRSYRHALLDYIKYLPPNIRSRNW